MKRPLVILTAALTLLLTGCVTGRRELTLNVPTASTPTTTYKGKVYLASVTDDREFQNKPSDPSTPSIDGDVTAISAAQKDRMIGRQRNGFGHAMGDISLADNDTVTQRVRLLVSEGFRRSGYDVVSDPAGAIPVTVSVHEFWGWFTPGFFALTFEAKIAVKVTLKTPTTTTSFTALGYGKNHGQVVKDGNWREAFEPAFDDFLNGFKHEMDKADLH